MFETIIENLVKLPQDTIQTYLSDSHLLFLLEESIKISLPSSFLEEGGRREEGGGMMEEGGGRREEGGREKNEETGRQKERGGGMMEEGGGKMEGGGGRKEGRGRREEDGGGRKEEGGRRGAGLIVLTKDETLNSCFDLIKWRIVRVLRKVISLESFKGWAFRKNGFDDFLKRVLGFMIDEIEKYVAFENSNFKMRKMEVC